MWQEETFLALTRSEAEKMGFHSALKNLVGSVVQVWHMTEHAEMCLIFTQ